VVSLWGSQAERFDAGALMEMGKNTPVVLLFVCVTSNIFDGRLALQCSATSTWLEAWRTGGSWTPVVRAT